jgi:hypothetical protein
MRKKIFIVIGILLLAYAAYFVYGILTTRSHSPSETKSISHQGLDVKVVYCRPYKKERLIFGEEKDKALVPYGKYWRLGANEATEITFSKDVTFGDIPVKRLVLSDVCCDSAGVWTFPQQRVRKFRIFWAKLAGC